MISVIIRSKNEEEWIKQCLNAVFGQEYEDFEVILVDNESTDATLDIAKEYDCKIVEINNKEFSYGRAINKGVEKSKGEFFACLSAHCIPLSTHWLFWLKTPFMDPLVGGVYGRQEPLESTPDSDKRDLWNTFGIERKIQMIDPFFHNANSMIKRSVWEKIKFDEKTSGVEDRIWAKKVLAHNFKIVYEPLASVYHQHGINQLSDINSGKRCKRVVRVIKKHRLYR